MNLTIDEIPTAVGPLCLYSCDEVVLSLSFGDADTAGRELVRRVGAFVVRSKRGATGELVRSYLEGELAALERVRVDTGGTPFQREVWSALRAIPVGRTVSYSSLAASIGRPRAVRAVAAANAANPIAIVVPCHRVVGKNGTLTGYAGGLERKAFLLAHEATGSAFRLERQSPR